MVVDYFDRLAEYNWWVVAIELLLIGLVVYWAVDFLEGTRGERLFRGVIFLLIAGVLILNIISERFHFDRLQYLYKVFLIGILIIVVVGFQPEIRRVLMRLGRAGGLLAGGSHQLSRTVEEIITALNGLSGKKTGAIIVVERQVGLGEFVETGVRLDAKVTSELLKTIFYEGTALHDMAVIIRADRIVAARVQLPLTEAGEVDGEELGSRHRAAMGITAGSDALCLVVSEETGVMSLAEGGVLIRNIPEKQLRKKLAGTMGRSGTGS